MHKLAYRIILTISLLLSALQTATAQVAGTPNNDLLTIVSNKTTQAVVIVSPKAGKWEKHAADDLVYYIKEMTDISIRLANTPESIKTALSADTPQLIIGQIALQFYPALQKVIDDAT